MKKSNIIFFVLCLMLLCFNDFTFAKIGLEVDGAVGFINPSEFNSDFTEAYKKILSPSTPLFANTSFNNSIYDLSGTLKFFLNNEFCIDAVISYLQPEFQTKLQISETKSLNSRILVPSCYLGIGGDYYLQPFLGFSLFFGANIGTIFPIGLNYKLEKLDASAFEGKESYFGEIFFAGNLKVGLQYLIGDSIGLSVFSGYRKAELKIKYPDSAPFNTKDSYGNYIFKEKIADISGIFVGAGVVLNTTDTKKEDKELQDKDKQATIRVMEDKKTMLSEIEKFTKTDRNKDYFLPRYDTRIELFVSNEPGKPKEKPKPLIIKNYDITATSIQSDIKIDKEKMDLPVALPKAKGPVYTAAPYSAFIDINKDSKRWFAFNLKDAKGATDVIWQVSTTNFIGGIDGWKNPPNLIKSGKIKAFSGEFEIDFGDLETKRIQIKKTFFTNYKPYTFDKRKIYYIRAVPVDAQENPIGEPGSGFPVIVGEPVVNMVSAEPKYELWTPLAGIGKYYGENQDRPFHRKEIGINPKEGPNERVFNIHGYKGTEGKIVIQVSDKPFTSNDNIPGKGNVLFEKQLEMPVKSSEFPSDFLLSEYPASMIIKFSDFAKKASEMKEKEYINYYVRGLIVKEGKSPGTIDVETTDTVVVSYGYGNSDFQWIPTPGPTYAYINRSLPKMKIKSYAPIRFSAQDSFNHYIVFRPPTADEIKCKWKNVQTGEILYPYNMASSQTYYATQGIYNKQQYEQKVIPRVLKPGTKVYIPPPKEEDKPWYEELYDGVVDFFEDIYKAVKELTNKISAAYNNLKKGLINVVVDLCPVESLKESFRIALEGMVNYGLVAIGIPPTLPNFDELSDMSLDYLAEAALTEAGIPENEITEAVVDNVKNGIKEQLENSAKVPAPNPVDAPFLKLDPDYMYRPAYVDIEFFNDSDYPTVPGTFDLNVNFEFDYWNMFSSTYNPAGGINFVVPTNYVSGSAPAIDRATDVMEHFLYGLNGNTVDFKNGGKAIYDVFKPLIGKTVPILRAHEKRTVRMYLELYPVWTQFTHYPTGESVTDNDIAIIYFANGHKDFINFYLFGHFPSGNEFISSTGILTTDPNVEYVYKSQGATVDIAEKKPVTQSWNR